MDTEARFNPDGEKKVIHSLRLGWAAHATYSKKAGLRVRLWRKILDTSDFWLWIARLALRTENLYVIAHNWDYDARLLRAFSTLPAQGWPPEYAILGDSCRFFLFSSDAHKIALVDNANFWRQSLAQLGQEFGIEKLEVDFTNATSEQLSRYCRRDVEILVRVWSYWLQFLDEHQLGDFAITAAGQAWAAFRHRFMPDHIGIHNNETAVNLERKAYHGGRVEVFKVGRFNTNPYYQLDVNGLYAHVMASNPFPQKLVKPIYCVSPDYLSQLLEEYLVCADVIVDTDTPIYPYALNSQRCYPVGCFRTQLTTPEVAYALEHDHIRAIGQVNLYEPGDLFTEFIDYLTPLRQSYKAAGDTGRSALCKLLRNSLQGKFGQKGYKQEIIGDAPLDAVGVVKWIHAETGERCEDWTFGGRVIRQYRTGEGPDSFPAIPAHVAAYARLYMWELVQMAGIEHCYYMDTDSLIVDEIGFQRLETRRDHAALGCLKLEGITTHLEIQAKKSYVFGDKTTLSGVKRDAEVLDTDLYRQWHFTSLKWAFAKGNLDDVLTYRVDKHIRRVVKVGLIQSNGAVLPADVRLCKEIAWSIIEPQFSHSWRWWVSPEWFAALAPAASSSPLLPPVSPPHWWPVVS